MMSCPHCGSTYVRRISRTFLMRLLVNSKHILCSDCGERSLVFSKSRKSRKVQKDEQRPARRFLPFATNKIASGQNLL
jgi:predicted RNA-binding Zn-ribbon protein involved in translation (DUF1610 family)